MTSISKLAFLMPLAVVATVARLTPNEGSDDRLPGYDRAVPRRSGFGRASKRRRATSQLEAVWRRRGPSSRQWPPDRLPLGEAGSSPINAARRKASTYTVVWVLDDITTAEQLIASEEVRRQNPR